MKLVKIGLFSIFLVFLFVISKGIQAGQSAAHCIGTTNYNDRRVPYNKCNFKITVFYCSDDFKRECGDANGETNKYYTHSKILSPGKKIYHLKGHYEYAVCEGAIFMNSKKFSSNKSGKYGCHN